MAAFPVCSRAFFRSVDSRRHADRRSKVRRYSSQSRYSFGKTWLSQSTKAFT